MSGMAEGLTQCLHQKIDIVAKVQRVGTPSDFPIITVELISFYTLDYGDPIRAIKEWYSSSESPLKDIPVEDVVSTIRKLRGEE